VYRQTPVFEDCRARFPDECELIIVEGESAAHSVAAIRHQQTQAVFSFQGKPMNAHRASATKVGNNELFRALSQAINLPLADSHAELGGAHQARLFGLDPNAPMSVAAQDKELPNRRYSRIIMLFDQDADGIHCGALALMFFARWMRPLLISNSIYMARAPMFLVSYVDKQGQYLTQSVYSPAQQTALVARLTEQGMVQIKSQHFRGLGSLNPELLREVCIDPQTRRLEAMTFSHAEQAIDVFCRDI
jgi:DNA gyrase subunit B